MIAIVARSLTRELGGREVVADLDLEVAPGSFFVFHRTWVNRPVDLTVRVVASEQHDLPPSHA